jgi:hypothetical protein
MPKVVHQCGIVVWYSVEFHRITTRPSVVWQGRNIPRHVCSSVRGDRHNSGTVVGGMRGLVVVVLWMTTDEIPMVAHRCGTGTGIAPRRRACLDDTDPSTSIIF